MSTSPQAALAEEYKIRGNESFKSHRFADACQFYTEAINIAATAVLYANRAFTHIHLENYGSAIADATKAIELDPQYVKGYYRRGCAYVALEKFKEAQQDFQRVLKLNPKDAITQEKAKQCQKEIQRNAFEKAIALSENEALDRAGVGAARPGTAAAMKHLASDTFSSQWQTMELEKDFDGVQLALPPVATKSDEIDDIDAVSITPQFFLNTIERYKAQKKMPKKYAIIVLLKALKQLRTMKSLFRVRVAPKKQLTVCGDTHGQFYDLCHIFDLNGLPSKENPYLFNGDFVDRGSFSVEVVMTLLTALAMDPECMYLTRGNHESRHLNRAYGFEGEVRHKYNEEVFELFQEVFNCLPLACVINDRVLVLHGGLFSRDGVKLHEIERIERFRDIPDEGLMADILWSDPMKEKGRAPSKRGISINFGPDVTHKFLDDNNLDLLIRSHEVKQDGYEIECDGRLITVFSAPNYCDQVGNKGAFIIFKNEADSEDQNIAFKPDIRQFSHSQHPKIPPMAYANRLYSML